MDTYQYFIENPKPLEPDAISEHSHPSVLFASIDPITKVRMVSGQLRENDVAFAARPDLASLQRNAVFRHHVSFRSKHTIRTWLAGKDENEIIVQVFHGETVYDLVLIKVWKNSTFREIKDRKFERFAGILACPYCKTGVRRLMKDFTCDACGRWYRHNGNAVDFLTTHLRSEFSITDTENVSDNGYDDRVTAAIEANPGKLFLDAGAGLKYRNYENVVHFEIVDYPSTDVLGVGEKLPFVNDSFDFVLSAVVLEHVKDPFACAREMVRVLRPGGELFCAAPFLQPRHGYPNHYYNMTREGLINLFDGLVVRAADVPNYLHPMAAITWILRCYAIGLPPELRGEFTAMKVEDVLKLFPPGNAWDHPLITRLSNDVREVIACGNFIHATKPLATDR
jgi:SAM-dependent methyltransferase